MPALKKGWHWNGLNFVYSKEREESDYENDEPDDHRTTKEIAKAMSSLVYFLRFTSDDRTMFSDGKLPTLDTALWVDQGVIKHTFYEKPTVGNQVLRRDTALPTASIRATLLQETVRRLLNTSVGTDVKTIQMILSNFAQKLVNSGHSQFSTKVFLVQGVTKYLYRVKLSKLPRDHPQFRPLYLAKEYKESQRQIDKYCAKMDWFRAESPV